IPNFHNTNFTPPPNALQAAENAIANSKIFPDEVVQDYVQTLGERLVKGAHTYKSIHFFVLQSEDINAFAGPNNYIAVYTGLISSLDSQQELAAVLAHEIAHVTQNHLQQMKTRANELNISALVAGLAAIAIGVKNPDMGNGALAAAMAG